MSTPTPTQQATAKQIDRVLLLIGLVAFLAVLTSLTVLTLQDKDTGSLLRLLGIIASIVTSAGYLGTKVNRVQEQVQPALARITEQTNGSLDRRIEDGSARAVHNVLQSYGIKPVPGSDRAPAAANPSP